MSSFVVRLAAVLGSLLFIATTVAAPSHTVLVVCAPGYPGSTGEAQSFLDDFARAAARQAGWAEAALAAVYYEDEAEGLKRLAEADAGLALVPLPFLLKHAAALGLVPRLHAVEVPGGNQVWSLVARKGAISKPEDLSGWSLVGRPGYAPAFIRGSILGEWGKPPADTAIAFAKSPLSALRRAAAGEKIAVILDRAQAEALVGLPFGQDLEIVTRAGPMPGMILATVGNQLDDASTEELVEALLRLHEKKPANEIMRSIWLSHFEKVDAAAMEKARIAYEGG